MTRFFARRGSSEPGQVLVIVAAGMIVMIAMVGLVVDGGFAWGQQRDTQNASDASAHAGAVVLAGRLAGVATTDSNVWTAVGATATANKFGATVNPAADCTGGAPDGGKDGICAYYTTIDGTVITGGSGPIAVGSIGAGTPPATASGVQAVARKNFDTFLMQVVGIGKLDAVTDATAVAGYVEEVCPASLGCAVLPVTVPVAIVTCNGSGDAILSAQNYQKNTVEPYVIPLCKNNPGNVGWLDWTPPAGGTSELVDSITNPNNPAIPVPSWQYITSTGNVDSKGVEDALNLYAGKTVLIPQFDSTCNTKPTGTETDPNFGCPAGNVGGNGQNQWYHLPQFGAFQFCGGSPNVCPNVHSQTGQTYTAGAYVNGSNKPQCDTGNGGTSCLVGRFVDFLTNTTITGNVGANSNTGILGVQLLE